MFDTRFTEIIGGACDQITSLVLMAARESDFENF